MDITIALQEEKTIGNVIILEDVIPPAKPYCKVNPLLKANSNPHNRKGCRASVC